jgi:hypothetical protein
MIRHRVIPKNEDPDDSIVGFGIDFDHYLKVVKARREWNQKSDNKLPLHTDFGKTFDKREGY